MTESEAAPSIEAACDRVTRIEVTGTQFPAASSSEVHLRCESLTLADGRPAGDAVFTFADDGLVLIDTRGGADNLRPENIVPVAEPGEFQVYLPHKIIVNTSNNSASLFDDFAIMPVAMYWENPAWTSDEVSAPMDEFFLPTEIVFGALQSDMETELQDVCPLVLGRPIEEVWLATNPAVQFQIDCYGYEIGGYPRKLEFVFGNTKLQQVWLMFGVADIPRLREFLTENYGAAISIDEKYEIFDDWRLALRKDIPEIRMVSNEIARISAGE